MGQTLDGGWGVGWGEQRPGLVGIRVGPVSFPAPPSPLPSHLLSRAPPLLLPALWGVGAPTASHEHLSLLWVHSCSVRYTCVRTSQARASHVNTCVCPTCDDPFRHKHVCL